MALGSHQQTVGKSQNHLTPKWIIDALGPFDLDPCASNIRPWDCAKRNYALEGSLFPRGGLDLTWAVHAGMVWLNPPFDRYEVHKWVEKLAQHNNGIALLHARTETEWFKPCWQHASAILFMDRRIAFCRPDGSEQPANSGAPPVLVAFGSTAKQRLGTCAIPGALITTWTFRKGQTP